MVSSCDETDLRVLYIQYLYLLVIQRQPDLEMDTNNEQLETTHTSRSEVELILKNNPQRAELFVNPNSHSEV